jgi:Uma2 family endonuclease
MTTTVTPTPAAIGLGVGQIRNLADLYRRLGGVPLHRIRFHPPPGTATIKDMLDLAAKEGCICELVEGVLVEKAMGYTESLLAAQLITLLNNFVRARKLGHVTAPDSTMEILANIVRLPDVSYLSWDRLPGRQRPTDAVPAVVPNIAIEILSDSNTPGEMVIKRAEYFSAGVTLVWEIDPRNRTVTVYTSPTQATTLIVGDTLLGAPALPGFSLPIADLFDILDEHG